MTAAAERPNVLWIVADQLRAQALGSGGDPNVATPHLDRLAAEGVRCTEAVSQYPVCTPFRASLMTGRYTPHHGVERHGDFIHPDAPTVAHAFAAAGYATSFVGKWHLAPESGAAFVTPGRWIGQDYWVHPRLRGGFAEWQGFNLSNAYFATYVARGEKVAPERLPGYQTDALTDLTLAFLDAHADTGPWFHVLAYESPHPGVGGEPRSKGYPVPEAYEDRFEPDALALRPNVPPASEAAAREQLAGYYRLIANLDDNVGRVLERLDALGLAESTLVVFLSDHGEMGGSHGLRDKHVPYDESLRIPLFWRWPGRLPAGARFDGPMCGVDVFPTTAGLCGVAPVGAVGGLDHAARLRDGGGAALRDAVLLQWEAPRFAFGDHPYRGLRTARHTFVLGRDDAFCMLFDREADPYEQRNLYADPAHAALVAELHGRLEGLLMEVEGALPAYVVERRPTARGGSAAATENEGGRP